MSGARPYGVGPYGAGAWPGYVVRELAGLAVAGVNTRGGVAFTWAPQRAPCETGAWVAVPGCATGVWTNPAGCGAGTWKAAA
jgi:hypothetical protein